MIMFNGHANEWKSMSSKRCIALFLFSVPPFCFFRASFGAPFEHLWPRRHAFALVLTSDNIAIDYDPRTGNAFKSKRGWFCLIAGPFTDYHFPS